MTQLAEPAVFQSALGAASVAAPTDGAAIRVAGISKCYQIYDRPQDRLKQAIVPRLLRLFSRVRRGGAAPSFFRDFWALRDVSFEVRRGETLGILGRNGAGKSTLLQIIAGTLSPTAGSIEVSGRVAALLELGSGFNPEFTGRENVYLNAALMGLSRAQTDAKFDEIAAFADIGDFIEQPIKIYSSGMMVRLAFAVQTAMDPSVLIVDEALAVGDARFQKKCYDRLERYRAEGGTVLFVTHDSSIVVQICSKALILEQGAVYDVGEPHRIAREYHRLLFGRVEGGNAAQADRPPPEVLSETAKHDAGGTAATSDADRDMFLAESAALRHTPTFVPGTRYGSREVEIIDMGIRDAKGRRTTLLDVHGSYEFFCRAQFRSAVHAPVAFGFILTNRRGLEIYGTKGGLSGMFLPAGAVGAVYECFLRIEIPLVPGDYFLTAALARDDEGGESAFYDCWFDGLQFSVIGSPRCFTTGVVDLKGEVGILELQNFAKD